MTADGSSAGTALASPRPWAGEAVHIAGWANRRRRKVMAKISTMHEAFLHELGDVYDAEQQLTKALPELIEMAQNAQLKQGMRQHLTETQAQVMNLEQVFKSVGGPPERVACKGMTGIIGENKSMLRDIKAPALADYAIVGGSLKVEHYEIASYRSLIWQAQFMGHNEAAKLLRQNLQQEEATATKLEQMGQQLGQELVSRGAQFVGHEVTGRQPIMDSQSGMGQGH
jgi:ferritin-like metal-binding protein YciE